ncbi:hypothetical protein PENSUB_9411 [Penicillium subrubescens]|uniref:Aminoglycoside phosphotransferase domain-containing protein n=1 Tax=Penicillium subrubescens TaxID=1316194 RepID=A0A1Q5TDL9_9EURO|nr:hypothetical protein PENSUB_9411 [Penicillium subrubescens]
MRVIPKPPRFTWKDATAQLRDVFDIPSPRVLSWSSDATNNSVKAEYIIEEKTPGLRLGSLWNKWPRELKLRLINQVVDMENELANVGFDKQGCIYFKEDLRSLVGEAEDIHAHNVDCDRFSVRPLTTNELWSGTSMSMKLDRGPWKDAPEYTRAIGQNEMAWIKAHTVPRMNFTSRTRTESFLKMVLPI